MTDWYEPWWNIRWDPTLPPDQRRKVIEMYARLYPSFRVFIETGTADGGTPLALHGLFDRVYTIELSDVLYKKFSPQLSKVKNIVPLLGDSMKLLPDILAEVNRSCVFWLDGHFCGGARGEKDTPVADELESIFATGIPHCILVDDARLFGRDPAYPTIEWVRNLATIQDIHYDFAYSDDIMRITPR